MIAGSLNTVLDEIDRDFDELGRQKARSDLLDKQFDQLDAQLHRYEKLFQLHKKVTGRKEYLRHFEAKRLRIEGARHTTRADLFWDTLDYDQALRAYAQAIQTLRAAIPLARAAGDQKLLASCWNNIGYAEIYSGSPGAGIHSYSRSLKIAERRKDVVYRGLYLLNLGTAYLYIGRPQDSLRYSLQAAELTQRSGRQTWEANALLNVGTAYLALGDQSNARDYLQRAWKKAEEAKDRRSLGRIVYNLALVAARAQDWQEAARWMEQALEWYQQNEEVYSRAEQAVVQHHALSFLRDACLKLNDLEKAERYEVRVAELRSKDPQKQVAYLADPHLNFYKTNREAKKTR
ncbi:MAG: tetratricopeptide repeat protein [Acidobacteria bacterium]|nr:tetratricopeptide repeat protein [Acidobacteriota bacterium]